MKRTLRALSLRSIQRRAYDDGARHIQRVGLQLSHRAADRWLDDSAMAWVRQRLGCRITTDDRGMMIHPAE